ncbi:MAG: hypothetical protein ACKD6O_08175 [Candidatus Bathyarchaeota archaeon]
MFDITLFSNVISGLIIAGLLVFYYFYFKRPIVEILRYESNTLKRFKLFYVKKKSSVLNYDGETYVIDWEKASYIDEKNRPHLFFLQGESTPLVLHNPKFKFRVSNDAKQIRHLMDVNLIKGLFASVFHAKGFDKVILVTILVCAIGCGIAIGFALYPHLFPLPQPQSQGGIIP